MVRRKGVDLPRTCKNCANYAQREIGRREMKQLRRNLRKSGPRTFEFAAQPFQHSSAVVAGQSAVSGNAHLQPGEMRNVEQMRAESWADVVTYLLKGAVIGTAGFSLCVPFAVWAERVPWYAPGVMFFAVGGVGILVSVFNPQEWLINRIEDVLQRDIDGDGAIGPVGYVVDGTLDDGHGHSLYLKFKLEGENAARKWHNFCRAVFYGGRNFSQNEAVKRQGLTVGDWERIYQAFTAQQWVIPAGPRGTPQLRAVGKHWIKLYADTPPPSGGE